jgi:hypothetical protein
MVMNFSPKKNKYKIKKIGETKEIIHGRICNPFTRYKERKRGFENTANKDPAVINITTQKSEIPNNNKPMLKNINTSEVITNLTKKAFPNRKGINL